MIDGLQDQIDLIETTLTTLLPNTTPEPLRSVMHHAVTAGGKRIRPLLTVLTTQMLGGTCSDAIRTGCAIEMIHTYSLIHDDLPAMDDDALRRGKPTVHIAFDEATAILAGDALQSLAFEIVACDRQLSDKTRIELIQIISKAVGATGMVAGQVLDMQNENKAISIDALKEMHNRKTGDLISTSIAAGACIAGASPEDRKCLETFGYLLGLAFQIRDDILDETSTTEALGKPQGSDKEQNKSTFTTLYGIQEAKQHLVDVRDQALDALKPLDNRANKLKELTHFVVDRLH